MSFKVYVDDNFNYMDEDERSLQGEYETQEEAIEQCKHIVDGCLAFQLMPGMTAKELFDRYTSFGEDPFIEGVKFSAWEYAEKRCNELCPVSL